MYDAGTVYSLLSEAGVPLHGVSMSVNDLLSDDLSLDDFEIDFKDNVTNAQKLAVRNRLSAFIGWRPAQREAWLAENVPKRPAEQLAELMARVAELEARLSALENV